MKWFPDALVEHFLCFIIILHCNLNFSHFRHYLWFCWNLLACSSSPHILFLFFFGQRYITRYCVISLVKNLTSKHWKLSLTTNNLQNTYTLIRALLIFYCSCIVNMVVTWTIANISILAIFQARSLPTDKLRICYFAINSGVYFVQVHYSTPVLYCYCFLNYVVVYLWITI